MSGTDENKEPQTGADGNTNPETNPQTGADGSFDEIIKEKDERISKLEAILEKTRKEAAENRINAKGKLSLEESVNQMQKQIEDLKTEKRNEVLLRKLDKAGCIKSELILKEIPTDCEDVDEFIHKYKESNAFLFDTQKTSHGGNFKGSGGQKLSSDEQMNHIIRSFCS